MTDIKRSKTELDATGQAVGRLASKIAMILRGKDKPTLFATLMRRQSCCFERRQSQIYR